MNNEARLQMSKDKVIEVLRIGSATYAILEERTGLAGSTVSKIVRILAKERKVTCRKQPNVIGRPSIRVIINKR